MMPSSGNQQVRNRQMMRRGEDIDPFLALRHEMDRVFDDLLRGFGMPSLPPPSPFGRMPAPMLAPHVDVSESDEEVRIAAELPGIDEQDVEVSLSGDILTIRGEKRIEQDEKGRDYRIVERARGSFSRSLRLPFMVDPAQVQATVKDGVLTITIPKPRELREKRRGSR
jgi:HSP20 family protein